MARVVNAVFNRLQESSSQFPSVTRTELTSFINRVRDEAFHIPESDRFPGRTSGKGPIDLTTAKHFLLNPSIQRDLINLIQAAAPTITVSVAGRSVLVHVAISVLLSSLTALYMLHSSKFPLSVSDRQSHSNHLQRFAQVWHAMQWKPTVWVHWLVAHSNFFLYKTFTPCTYFLPFLRNACTKLSKLT